MSKKPETLSDQIRAAVNAANKAGVSRYKICCRTGIDQGAMSRFMAGSHGLLLQALDRLAVELGLTVKVDRAKVREWAKAGGKKER